MFGLQLGVKRSTYWTMVAVWAIWSVVGIWIFQIPWTTAFLFGPLAVILHWLSDLIHQFGHAWAARRTGYPMEGITFWGPFSTAIYPSDEPPLPDYVHMQRALGGPFVSFVMSILGALWLLLTVEAEPAWRWLAWFFFLDNFVVLTMQVFLPLGFNDGATIWHWLRHGD